MDDLFSFWTSSQESPVLVIGAVLFCGAVSGRVAEWVRLPPITGYIIAGLLLGPYGSGLISQTMLLGPLHVFTTVSLAAIAFNIGSEFALSKLKAIGWTVVGLTLAQFLGSLIGVFTAMLLIGISAPYALLLGAIATSTAPTTTYLMVKSLRARGKFIAYLYGVIALNDACCVILFGLVSTTVIKMVSPGGDMPSVLSAVAHALTQEFWSVAYGAGMGGVISMTIRLMERDPRVADHRVQVTFLGLALITIGAALVLGLSHLLAPLTAGLMMANMLSKNTMARLNRLVAPFLDPLFLIFLVLAGAQLHISTISNPRTVLIATVYVLVRLAGKYTGTALAATAFRLDRRTRSCLGLCLVAQGGLVIGLLLTFAGSAAIRALPIASKVMFHALISAVLLAVLIAQLIGPTILRFGITRGAESFRTYNNSTRYTSR